jgi:glycosyltransferase involved in cell wall biosynthesis
VAIILTCYYRPKPGGFCARLFRALRALLAAGHTVHYLAVVRFPIDHPRCHFHRFPWPAGKTDSLLFWAVFHLLTPFMLVFLAVRHSITHAFGFSTTYALLLKPACWILSVDLVCFLRGDARYAHGIKGRPALILLLERTFEALAIRQTHLVGVSVPLLNTTLRRNPTVAPLRTEVLPNDLPRPATRQVTRRDKEVVLGLVGLLEPTKNYAFIINRMVALRGSDCRLCIFGAGPSEQSLKRLVKKLRLENSVRFEGWVSSDTIWSQIDVLINPSLNEGMPNAVLEAIASSVAVLASDIPAHREILPAECLLPLGEAERWRNRIRFILADPQTRLQHIREAQWRTAQRFRFDWDAAVVCCILSSANASRRGVI